MDSDATSLDALLPSPQGPQSMGPVAGVAGSDHHPRGQMAPSFKPSLPAMRFMFSHAALYVSFFLAVMIVSFSTPRNLLLQYIPSAYTSGGVLSYQGAAVLGAAAVVIAHMLNVFFVSIVG
jgi:hypothetical protein